MTPTDWTVLAAYLVAIALTGLALSRGSSRPEEFHVAGRSMGWLPVGLSVMATAFGPINYVAFSGEVFAHGLYVVLCLPAFVIVAWPVTRLIMPFFHPMELCSAYEYLERRFDLRVRCLASGLFIVWRVAWMAVTFYVLGRVASTITGVGLPVLVAVIGGIAVLYTAAGGMRAVMWTDVAQFLVLLGGLLVAGFTVAGRSGGLSGLMRAATQEGLMRPFYPFDAQILAPDPTARITLWSALIGTFVVFLARYGADQMTLQRYFAARNLRDAQRGFWLNSGAAIVTLLLTAGLGVATRIHAVHTGLVAAPLMTPTDHVASFIMSLPAGVCGLIVAGLMAAAMSSIDSGIHSCSTAWSTDFAGRVVGRQFVSDRALTVLFGAAAMLLACYVGRLGSLFAIANKIINGLGSPLLAVMLLAMFSRRANATGVFIGGMIGAVGSVFISLSVDRLALHLYAVANLALAWGAGYAGSLVAGWFGSRATEEQTSWTWWGRRSVAVVGADALASGSVAP